MQRNRKERRGNSRDVRHVLVRMVVRKINQVGKREENRTNQGNIPGLGNVEEILLLKDEDCLKLPEFIKDFVRHWSLGQIRYSSRRNTL